MDQPTGNPKDIFDAIQRVGDLLNRIASNRAVAKVAHIETQRLIREFDNTDYNGDNSPTPQQKRQAMAVVRKARELRKIINN